MKKNMGIFFIISLIFCLAPLAAKAADNDEVSIEPYAKAFAKNSQNVTAYTASKYKANGNLRKTASSLEPKSGYVAMKVATVTSTVPFGSIVMTPQRIKNYDGANLDSYTVQDTGVEPALTDYAIDIWWGFCRSNAFNGSDTNLGCSKSDAVVTSANNWGKPKMNLNFIIKE